MRARYLPTVNTYQSKNVDVDESPITRFESQCIFNHFYHVEIGNMKANYVFSMTKKDPFPRV